MSGFPSFGSKVMNGVSPNTFRNLQIATKYMGLKAMRLLIAWIGLEVATNYMSQIYVEKVFVDQENPQHLFYLMLIWAVIDLFFNILIMLTLYILKMYGMVTQDLIVIYMLDMFAVTATMLLTGWIISSVMFKKKYFGYREDGLRGIRAFREIMFYLFLTFGSLPLGFVIAIAGLFVAGGGS